MPADGGSGAAAEAAKLKREQEEAKIIEQAKEEERERKRAEKARVAERVKATVNPKGETFGFQKKEVAPQDKLWTDRHAPTDLNQLCGNKGQIQKLKSWLENWFDNQARGSKEMHRIRFFPSSFDQWTTRDWKTSAAHLVAKSLGFDIIERSVRCSFQIFVKRQC